MVMGGWKVIYFLIEHTDYSIYIMKGSSAELSIEQKYDMVMTVNTLFLTAEWQKISAPKVFYCFSSNKNFLNVTDKWMAQRCFFVLLNDYPLCKRHTTLCGLMSVVVSCSGKDGINFNVIHKAKVFHIEKMSAP